MSNATALVGQTLGQPRALAVSSGRRAGRLSGSVKFAARSSLGAQSAQRPQRAQTCVFAMTADEAQANPDSVTGIISISVNQHGFCLILELVGLLLVYLLHCMLIES